MNNPIKLQHKPIYATAFKHSEEDLSVVANQIVKAYPDRFIFEFKREEYSGDMILVLQDLKTQRIHNLFSTQYLVVGNEASCITDEKFLKEYYTVIDAQDICFKDVHKEVKEKVEFRDLSTVELMESTPKMITSGWGDLNR